ncbi:uncharacterized protein LOC127690897 isoform X1 [Apodemus sylvaticus]|uniref:uncharacterized protein LOC127690897 isoform X1 n=1 Tax=Apodemus sylvaticus TaxID=10129 RepID=UPI0022449D24|nr:uncharacterized protein LOC127690897 isoform X1 [Apodemus sylvaticus]
MPRVNDGLQSLAELNKNPVGGFSAGLIDDNDLYLWKVLIIGPPDTLYEGGVFKAYLIFPKDYPLRPPKMKFITDIWPPNGKLPLIWNKIKTGWSSLVPDTGKLSWPRQQSSVRKNSGSVSNHGTGRSPFHPGANIQLEWQYYQNKILKGEADRKTRRSQGSLFFEVFRNERCFIIFSVMFSTIFVRGVFPVLNFGS